MPCRQQAANRTIVVRRGGFRARFLNGMMAMVGVSSAAFARRMRVGATWDEVQTGPQKRDGTEDRQQNRGGELPN